MEEVWKPVVGYEGYYEVSNKGRVKSIPRNGTINAERILSPQVSYNGYQVVHFRKKGVSSNQYVHRLVAEAFIPNPDNLPQVNHKSEVKTENNVENLEWCDSKYNVHYGTGIERKTETLKITHQKYSKPVSQYTLDNEYINTYFSSHEAERQTGVNHNYISKCCRKIKRFKTAGGYKWEYA